MQIIIPMAGFGARFQARGYKKPKPLLDIAGKPVIARVLDMFPGETDITLICNRDHVEHPDYALEATIKAYCKEAKIVAIAPHDLGPVYSVCQAMEHIDMTRPSVVCYCDFTCDWDYADFKRRMRETDCDGCVPSYRGDHPHYLVTPTNYANLRVEELPSSPTKAEGPHNIWMLDIQEKQPFTDDPWQEFASSGCYYFKTGAILKQYFEKIMAENMKVNNEFYVSMVYKAMVQDHLRVLVYELNHFVQWGTPEDFEIYEYWSNWFESVAKGQPLEDKRALTYESWVYDYWKAFFEGWPHHIYRGEVYG